MELEFMGKKDLERFSSGRIPVADENDVSSIQLKRMMERRNQKSERFIGKELGRLASSRGGGGWMALYRSIFLRHAFNQH